ncbi:MAG: sel1 repeat family protein, partial [Lachnospiraceae bacterium]|nr:sel1 repeat family protein [Lachnospiraceae bacterium]
NIEYIEKKTAEKGNGVSYTYYSNPIGWQRHIYFYDDSVLDLGQPADWSEEEKLQYAIKNGEYEAYNNLALLFVDEDDDKALTYFKLAVENNILFGILNLSLWYYKHNDIPNFIEYTRLAADNKDVIAMYNLAFAQFSDEYGVQDTESAIEQYKRTIEECERIKYDEFKDEEEKTIVEEWDNTVLQRSYYDLAVIYYRKGEFGDLLLAYAYLNQCPRQIEIVRDLKSNIYKSLLDRHTEYDDLPF